MTNEDFLKLKQRYYREGHKPNLPDRVAVTGRPGAANSREQNALRWGYEAALLDVRLRFAKMIVED